MWKLFEPRSTAARTSGTGRTAAPLRASAVARMTAAGLTRAKWASDREGRTAPARSRRLRIADHELGALEALPVVDLSAGKVLHAHGIDEELHAKIFNAGVPIDDLFIELEPVREPRAAAALHKHPQHELRIALALDQRPDLAGRGLR